MDGKAPQIKEEVESPVGLQPGSLQFGLDNKYLKYKNIIKSFNSYVKTLLYIISFYKIDCYRNKSLNMIFDN